MGINWNNVDPSILKVIYLLCFLFWVACICCKDLKGNFDKINGYTYYYNFDYESIMLYGPYLFSVNKQKTTYRLDGG